MFNWLVTKGKIKGTSHKSHGKIYGFLLRFSHEKSTHWDVKWPEGTPKFHASIWLLGCEKCWSMYPANVGGRTSTNPSDAENSEQGHGFSRQNCRRLEVIGTTLGQWVLVGCVFLFLQCAGTASWLTLQLVSSCQITEMIFAVWTLKFALFACIRIFNYVSPIELFY